MAKKKKKAVTPAVDLPKKETATYWDDFMRYHKLSSSESQYLDTTRAYRRSRDMEKALLEKEDELLGARTVLASSSISLDSDQRKRITARAVELEKILERDRRLLRPKLIQRSKDLKLKGFSRPWQSCMPKPAAPPLGEGAGKKRKEATQPGQNEASRKGKKGEKTDTPVMRPAPKRNVKPRSPETDNKLKAVPKAPKTKNQSAVQPSTFVFGHSQFSQQQQQQQQPLQLSRPPLQEQPLNAQTKIPLAPAPSTEVKLPPSFTSFPPARFKFEPTSQSTLNLSPESFPTAKFTFDPLAQSALAYPPSNVFNPPTASDTKLASTKSPSGSKIEGDSQREKIWKLNERVTQVDDQLERLREFMATRKPGQPAASARNLRSSTSSENKRKQEKLIDIDDSDDDDKKFPRGPRPK